MMSNMNLSVAFVALVCLFQVNAKVSSKCQEAFHAEILKSHNDLRAERGVKPIFDKGGLTGKPQQKADQVLANPGKEVKAKNGESVFVAWKSTDQQLTEAECTKYAKRAVNIWNDEMKNYDIAANKAKPDAGRIDGFAQVLWENTQDFTALLATKVIDGSTAVVVVANYKSDFAGKNYAKNIIPFGKRNAIIGEDCQKVMDDVMFRKINELRVKHHVEPLTKWEDSGVSEWADKKVLTNTNGRQKEPKGFNHFDVWYNGYEDKPVDFKSSESCAVLAEKAVDFWYSKLEGIDFETGKDKKGTWTREAQQILFKWTTRINFAVASRQERANRFRVAVFARANPQHWSRYVLQNVFPIDYVKPAPGKISTKTTLSEQELGVSRECQMAYQESALAKLNEIRVKHQVPPMTYWEDPNQSANKIAWGNRIKNAWNVTETWRSMGFDQLYERLEKNVEITVPFCKDTGAKAIKKVYEAGLANYDFKTNGPVEGKKWGDVRQFVQMLWKWTEKVQFGICFSTRNRRVNQMFNGAQFDIREHFGTQITDVEVLPAI